MYLVHFEKKLMCVEGWKVTIASPLVSLDAVDNLRFHIRSPILFTRLCTSDCLQSVYLERYKDLCKAVRQ